MSEADDVLRSIDQLRRDLSGYHGQLKAHNDLQRHCDRQREQLAALGAAHKPVKDERDAYKRQADRLAAENANLKAQVETLKDYAHALELCRGEAYLCEYCTFNGIDFEHSNIHCTIDFDGLRKKAGMDA